MIYGDYHVHSTYSRDAKNSVAEQVQSAIDKGLKQVAITDHASCHTYGMSEAAMRSQISEVERVARSSKISVLKGVEANLVNQMGKIDVPKKYQEYLDIMVLGCHKSCRGGLFARMKHTKMFLATKNNIDKNTDAYIKALQENKINIVAHPNYAVPIDCVRLAKYCKEHNIYFELNGRKHCMDDATFRAVIDTGVMFILDSDAHNSVDVGNVRNGLTVMEKYNIPEAQIANLNKLPIFNKRI
ncbi:MAG: PHP domain-containing protein [Clostridiales bacterium]|nr:PHP domain-containing protein [Clostridiales bacterium]